MFAPGTNTCGSKSARMMQPKKRCLDEQAASSDKAPQDTKVAKTKDSSETIKEDTDDSKTTTFVDVSADSNVMTLQQFTDIVLASEGMKRMLFGLREGMIDHKLAQFIQYNGEPLGCHMTLAAGGVPGLSGPVGSVIRRGDPLSTCSK